MTAGTAPAMRVQWADAAVEFAGAMGAVHRKKHEAAYRGLAAAYSIMVTIMAQETGWLLPLLRQSTYDMRVLAEVGDYASAGGSGQVCLRDCSEKFMKAFAGCITDKKSVDDPESRKRGVVFVVVSSFRVYFKIANYPSCKHMITPLERSTGPAGSLIESRHIGAADRVTFKFYKGRLCVYEDK